MFQPLGKRRWMTTEPINWDVGYKQSGLTISVPAHFPFDGASSPWFSWLVIRPEDPRVMVASAIHDYLYREMKFSRIVADAIFYNVMRENNFPRWRAIVAWFFVRLVNKWK